MNECVVIRYTVRDQDKLACQWIRRSGSKARYAVVGKRDEDGMKWEQESSVQLAS